MIDVRNRTLKLISSLLISVVLTSCSFNRYIVKAPTTKYMDDIELLDEVNIKVEDVPKVPKISKSKDIKGKDIIALDLNDLNKLLALKNVAKKNTLILEELAISTKYLIRERNALVKIAKETERRSNLIAKQWAETEEQRRIDEDINFIERTIYKIIIGISLVLAL